MKAALRVLSNRHIYQPLRIKTQIFVLGPFVGCAPLLMLTCIKHGFEARTLIKWRQGYLFVRTTRVTSCFCKHIFLLILCGYPRRLITATVRLCSASFYSRAFTYPLRKMRLFYFPVTSISVQRNLRSLVTSEIAYVIVRFIRLSISKPKYLPLGCLSDTHL